MFEKKIKRFFLVRFVHPIFFYRFIQIEDGTFLFLLLSSFSPFNPAAISNNYT